MPNWPDEGAGDENIFMTMYVHSDDWKRGLSMQGVPTERELQTIGHGQPVYRVLLTRR